MTESEIQQGDKVSWNWGSGQPGGKVAEVKEQGEIAIESNRGNTIKKNAEPENPAVHIERSGNDVVKRASELQIDSKAEGGANGDSKQESKDSETDNKEEKVNDNKPDDSGKKDEEKKDEEKKDEEMKDAPTSTQHDGKKEKPAENGDSKAEADKAESKEYSKEETKDDDAEPQEKSDEAQPGDKRKVGDTNGADAEKKAPASKKTKTDDDEAGDDDKAESDDKAEGGDKTGNKPKGKAGRPKASEKKEPAKKKQSKPAATEDGQPRRSARNKLDQGWCNGVDRIRFVYEAQGNDDWQGSSKSGMKIDWTWLARRVAGVLDVFMVTTPYITV
ncbi:hypothetical protein OPT61_g5616 [Boeremia exigua]|uniref:Uncharacterized protein n=1 Tax=Boeremia exigua TaxID=749465 RepID=A0ACC2I9S4_9PLEO|nr:hypothetical protein OPT61_g5616 [Boeremia exigua]